MAICCIQFWYVEIKIKTLEDIAICHVQNISLQFDVFYQIVLFIEIDAFVDVAFDKLVALCIQLINFRGFHNKLHLHPNVDYFIRLYNPWVLHSCASCPFINHTNWISPFINVYLAPDSSLPITSFSLTGLVVEIPFWHPPPNIVFQGFCEFRLQFCIESLIEFVSHSTSFLAM